MHKLAVEPGLIDPELVEGQFGNPGCLQQAVAGIQAGAHVT